MSNFHLLLAKLPPHILVPRQTTNSSKGQRACSSSAPPSTAIIQCIRIPADGSAPHLVSLPTTPVYTDLATDMFLHHTPDVRAFWGALAGWTARDHRRWGIRRQPEHSRVLEGEYYAFVSRARRSLPPNRLFRGAYGDVFLAKVSTREARPEDGWAEWVDVPDEMIGSGALQYIMREGFNS